MKINDGLTSQQLKDKLLGYGLDPSGKSTDEMETMLAAIIFAELHPNEEIPDQINPMLASDASALAKDVVDKMLSSEQYIAQDKINGMRCCGGECQVWLPNGTTMSIREIVENEYDGKVLGYKDGKIVPVKVLGWAENEPSKEFFKIRDSQESRGTLRITDLHKVLSNGE